MAPIRVTTIMGGIFNTDTANDDLATVLQAVFEKRVNACCVVPTTVFDGDSAFVARRYGFGFVAVCGKWLFYTQSGKSWFARRIGSDNHICNLFDRAKREQALEDLRRFEMDGHARAPLKKAEAMVADPMAPSGPAVEAPPIATPVYRAQPPPPPTAPRRFETPATVHHRNFPPESIWPVVIGIVIVVCMCLFFGFVGRSNTAPSQMDTMMLMMMRQSQEQRHERAAELQQMQQQREREQRDREEARELRRKQHEADLELKRAQHAAEMELRRQQEKTEREERQSTNMLTTMMQMMSLGGGDRADYFLGGGAAVGPAAVGPARRAPSQELALVPVQQPRSTMDTIVYGIVIVLGSLFTVWKCGQCLCPDVRAAEYMEDERYEQEEQAQQHYQEQTMRPPPQFQHYDKWGNTVHRLKYE